MAETRYTQPGQQVGTEMPQHRGQDRGQDIPEPTGWVGWILFAGIIMILAGVFQAIAGLVAILNEGYYLVPAENLVVAVNYTGWGVVHLIVGILLVLVGFGVMTGQLWARITGIILAGLSAIVHLGFIAAFPVWSAIVIALDIVIIYALAVHGREAANF